MKLAAQIRMLCVVMLTCGVSIAQQDNWERANSHISNQLKSTGYTWEIDREHTSPTSGVHHIYYYQTIDGLPVLGTASSLHLDKSGSVISNHERFLSMNSVGQSRATTPSVSASEALMLALDYTEIDGRLGYKFIGYEKEEKKASLVKKESLSNLNKLEDEVISPASLKFMLNDKEELRLVWDLSVLNMDETAFWNVQIDALTGSAIQKVSQIYSCAINTSEEEELNYNTNLFDRPNYTNEIEAASSFTCVKCYEVFEYPKENPYFGDRTIVESPHDLIASPYGWHDVDGSPGAEFLTTQGNNIIASEGGDHYGYQPDVTDDLNFTGFSYDPVFMESNQSEDASLTNVFYWGNLCHDISYAYGFTPDNGNHQQNGYGVGLLSNANDPLIVTVQSTLDNCNGVYLNFPDGVSSQVRMYLCGTKDGGFDSTVFVHEYAHAITIRMESIANSTCGGNDENPNEGWSDWYGLMFTMTDTDTGERPRGIGAYFTSEGIDGTGFREYPYSTDFNVNPLTYEYLEAGMGRHKVGAIWASILWEVTWELIDEYGFDQNLLNFTGTLGEDAGNIMALAIATESLNLTPCKPSMVDTRDAILSAARVIYGNDVECFLWEAFARRGLGFNASPGSSQVVGDEMASFEFDGASAVFDLEFPPICSGGGTEYGVGGGYPIGGVYSGPGVTDRGNGRAFDFDPLAAGLGDHIITYELEETSCYPGSTVTTVMTVVLDEIPPIVECNTDMLEERLHPSLEKYEIPDLSGNTYIIDECMGVPDITQDPPIGALVDPGITTITFTAEDLNGNVASCSFELEVTTRFEPDPTLPPHLNDDLVLIPNPSNGDMVLSNLYEYRINQIEVRDLSGRFVHEQQVNNKMVEVPVRLDYLAQGMYFVKIDYKKTSRTFRIIIE